MDKEELARELEALIEKLDTAIVKPGLARRRQAEKLMRRAAAALRTERLAALSPPNVAGEEVGGREAWEILRDISTPATFYHDEAGWESKLAELLAALAPTTEVRAEGEVERLRESLGGLLKWADNVSVAHDLGPQKAVEDARVSLVKGGAS